MGVERNQASFLISAFGISNIIGKICLGYLSDRTWTNRLYLYNISLAICGLSEYETQKKREHHLQTVFDFTGILLSNFCMSFATQMIYCVVFGFTYGSYRGLAAIVLIDIIGIEKFVLGHGVQLLFMGIATIIGPILTGRIHFLKTLLRNHIND